MYVWKKWMVEYSVDIKCRMRKEREEGRYDGGAIGKSR